MFSKRWLLVLPPFLLLAALLIFSPNFQWRDGAVRSAPYGGDFLQEWIGGRVVLSRDRHLLYDSETTRNLQHDSELVGFDWPDDQFFPMVYPPFHYLIVSPLSGLDYRWAAIAWAVFSFVAFVLTGVLIYRLYPPARTGFAGWCLAATLFVPWIKTLSMGQKSGVLLMLFTGTFLLLSRRRPFWAGVVFGLVAIKPQLGLVIGGMMLLHRQWWFAAGAGLSVGALIAVSGLIEPGWWPDYLEVVLNMGDYPETGGYQLTEAHNLWGGMSLMFSQFSPNLAKSMAGLMALIVLGIVVSGWRYPIEFSNGNPENPARQPLNGPMVWSQWMFATVLVSPHFYTYDLTLLLLPIVLVLTQVGLRPETKSGSWLLGLSAAMYALAGAFPKLAEATGVAWSVPVLVGLVVASGIYRERRETRDERRETRDER